MTPQPAGLLSRNWLMGFRTDLVWIILSAAVGWAYLALILGVGAGLENPIRDTFATLRIGDFALPLSLGLVVVASWAIVLDAPTCSRRSPARCWTRRSGACAAGCCWPRSASFSWGRP